MICPILMFMASSNHDPSSTTDQTSQECPMEKCAWWVTYRAPYLTQECAVKHISDMLHQQLMLK